MNSIQAMLYRAGVGADLVIPIAQNNIHLRPVMQLAKHFATKFAELGAHTLVAERHFQGSIKSETGVEIISVRKVVYDLGAGRAPYITFIAGDLCVRLQATTEIIDRCCSSDGLCIWCAAEASSCGICAPSLTTSSEVATN